jgi:hypothetical protein
MPFTKNMRKTKGWIINPYFQLRCILFMNAVAVGVIGVFYVSLRVFFEKFNEIGNQLELSRDHIFFVFVLDQEVRMNRIFIVASLVIIVFISLSAIVFSHRIAGPLYKLRKHLEAVAMNPIPMQIRFRKTDFFQELPPAYNAAAAALYAKGAKSSLPSESRDPADQSRVQ